MAGSLPHTLYQSGRFVKYEDATVHAMSPAVKYGALIFEGLRAYWNEAEGKLFVFRAEEHIDRLFESAKVSRMELSLSKQELLDAVVEVIRRNDQREDVHVRINAYVDKDNGTMGTAGPIGTVIASVPIGYYGAAGTVSTGQNVCISSWTRIDEASMPPRVKTAANYHNSRLAIMQAHEDGYDDAILLDRRGRVTEGPGYNIFLVRGGRVVTPSVTSGILEGVTRSTLIALFRELHGTEVVEREIDRTELYLAEEAFYCGSGKEVAAIASVDRHPIGDGQPGPITSKIHSSYLDVVRGMNKQYSRWLLPVF